MRAKELVLVALLSALLLVVQVSLAFLPNIELVSLLIILYTIVFSIRITLWVTGVFILLEGLIYGFTLWWINWLYLWPLLILLAWCMRRSKSALLWASLSGGFGLCFGALCSIPYFFLGGISGGISYWISGIPFDIAHGVGNFLVMLLLYRPLFRGFSQSAKKYNIKTQAAD